MPRCTLAEWVVADAVSDPSPKGTKESDVQGENVRSGQYIASPQEYKYLLYLGEFDSILPFDKSRRTQYIIALSL